MTTCPSGVNYMHIIDHGRNYIERNFKRSFFDRLIRNVLSYVLPRANVFLFLGWVTRIVKPLSFLMPGKVKDMSLTFPGIKKERGFTILVTHPRNKKTLALGKT
jgi:glycolate oxidase iron-sulfur subunit